MFDKPYDPKTVEPKIYETWEKSGFFNPDNLPTSKNQKLKASAKGGSAFGGKRYVVYMPLPNVTGSLHMGHALDNTAPDVLIRYYRMRGRKTLWLPGTDHAGIATQYVVEKELKKEGKTRFDLGREKFIERVWEWKEKYGDIILGQLKKLGVSADWSRTRFTMDKEYSEDVLKAFVHYYKNGLIYQGLRTVNWCPRCSTSLSELELEYTEGPAKLYYIRYGPFSLATVRPETKFGDTALAVNPRDSRYGSYVGKTLEVDSLDTEGDLDKPRLKKIKLVVVADEAVDQNFGTGVVKVTPAHDLTDFEIGERHKLPMTQVIDARGRMNENAGKYAGMKAQEAREKIAADLRAVGLIEKEEDYINRVSKCYRCGTTIEPIPSKQWFLKMGGLAKKAIAAVKNGRVKIAPENFNKTYFNWLSNIRDWTISRQIWWGHQIPVWFCKNQQEFEFKSKKLKVKSGKEKFAVSIEKPKTCPICKSCEMAQSEDVLDTWFSSALWPFAGLTEKDRKKYYPGNLVSNAREILNLWDARMIFSGLEFMGRVPFKNALIHGTILTKEGKRMSKSLGTGIDPLKYVEEHGADATRFAVLWQASGQDIRWDESAVFAGKKFANKIWNAARFVIEKSEGIKYESDRKPSAKTEEDGVILKKLESLRKQVSEYIEGLEFSKPLHEIYEFFWHDFCDKYLEASKSQLQNEKLKENTKRVLIRALGESLKTIHPFMPFITEEIWRHLPKKEENLLMVQKW